MARRPDKIDDPLKSYDSIHIWSDMINEWVVAFERRFQYLQPVKLLDAHVFNATDEAKNSDIIDVRPYARGLLMLNIDFTGTADSIDIVFRLQFSHNQVDWHTYMIGPWGDLRYIDADKKECLDFPIIAHYMRLRAVSSGCSSSNYLTVTAKAVLQN